MVVARRKERKENKNEAGEAYFLRPHSGQSIPIKINKKLNMLY